MGGGFGADFFGTDAIGEEIADEVGEGGAQCLAVGAEGGNAAGREGGGTVNEEDVAAHFEGGVVVGEADGVVKKRPGSHEGGGGESAGLVEFDDGAIDAGGEAEVVGVDEKGHRTGYRVYGSTG